MKSDVQKILSYYLEYEIYNISNSSHIQINNKNCLVIKDKINENNFLEYLNKLQKNKFEDIIEKFIGKRKYNKSNLIDLIVKKINELEDDYSNKIQIFDESKELIKQNLSIKNDKIVDNLLYELCDIKLSKEFWLYVNDLNVYTKKDVKKQPLFILKCKFENKKIKIIEVNLNIESMNRILSILLGLDISYISLKYEEKFSKYLKEIKSIIDSGDIKHIIDLFYIKLEEYIDPILSKENIENISKQDSNYEINKEYIISLDELVDDTIKNIKEDIELLKKRIYYDNNVPKLLNKYLIGNNNKNNINDSKYQKVYMGNYKSEYGVGDNQYKIVNTISDNDLIAVEGPPGTGKTSLLKEIIANKIVERTNLILENWDQEFSIQDYYGNKYYEIDWYKDNSNIIKSIVVSSKNGEAIENVSKEINQEMEYMFLAAKNYKRRQRTKEGILTKTLQNYKGIVCLPLGKKDNINDFRDFLYEEYIPNLEKLQLENEDIIEKIKVNYILKLDEVKKCENIIASLNKIKDKKKYFYGIEKIDKTSINKIQELFIQDEYDKKSELQNIITKKEKLQIQLKEIKESLELKKQYKDNIECKIQDCQHSKENRLDDIYDLQKKKNYFNKIAKNIITKLLNYKEYKENKNYNFDKEIFKLVSLNEMEDKKLIEYVKEENLLDKECYELNNKYSKINNQYQLQSEKEMVLNIDIEEINLINNFNNYDKGNYWSYKDNMEMYCKSSLNDLNQELFELALKLNEAYIIKNSKEIIENLKLFLPDDDMAYICPKFYDSTDIYNEKKQNAIRNLWNTLFLCFPVVTTTLDSFCKKCFHLIPEYIDLEMIDEAGQILPHNLVSALYRAKKAVIVGDAHQIEPIYSNVNKDFNENRQEIGINFQNIQIEDNSIQILANKNTDILNNNDNIILNNHYRCEKNIINFSNENVYNNKLNMHVKDNMNKPFLNNMIALDVRGKKTVGRNENKAEIESCIETIKYIYECSEKKPTIAVITPFREQKYLLDIILKREKLLDVKVGTVHAFQGQEKDYIIFLPVIDSVEPKWAPNFIGKKSNMLNVAVTRAKKQFIYIGNLKVALQTDNYIAKLIKYINKNGQVYSLYDNDTFKLNENFDEKIFQILQPKLELDNDIIGLYIKKNFENGIILDAKQHYNLLMYSIKNAKKEIFIASPWLMDNVINEEFLNEVKRLKENKCIVKIVFGYKKGKKQISSLKELIDELEETKSLGYATKDVITYIAQNLYSILGKENFIYAPPIHAKVVIVDDKYLFIGSHNWLSNAGKTNEKLRAKEGTRITTCKDSIRYVKENIFNSYK